MSEDGRSMLTQFEALYTKLEKTITEMEAIESIEVRFHTF